jgi:hypothetical protein
MQKPSYLVGQRRVGGGLELVLVLGNECRVDLDLGRGEGRSSDELERLVATMSTVPARIMILDAGSDNLPDQLSGEPEERLLEVVLERQLGPA